jgi:uncharacterized protein (DUF58 family)
MSNPTLRWRGGVAAAIVLAIAGLATTNGVILLSAVVPLAYVAYGSVATADLPTDLTAARVVDPSPAPPGRPVRVELTVTNDSDRTLSDVRVVDDVPTALAVMEGSPRAGTTLEPGESTTVEYAVVARRGEHDFDPPRVRLRSLGAGAAATADLPVDGDVELVCRLDAAAPPLADDAANHVGQITTDSPGRGVEFHSTREYRHGDDANRIDWRHYAKRGTLATVNYREHRSASIVAVVDARESCRVVSGPGRPTAVELAAYAATHAVGEFLRSGHDVAVAVVGLDGPGPAGLHWLPPGGGEDQRSRARDAFELAADAETTAEDPGAQFTQLLGLAPPRAQIALFSPLLDDPPVDAVETWLAHDYSVVALSPDVVTDNTVSGQCEQVRRGTRLARCQAAGARALDWRRGTPLPVALEYAFAADAGHAARRGVAHGQGGDA